jgi:hypothetical protein
MIVKITGRIMDSMGNISQEDVTETHGISHDIAIDLAKDIIKNLKMDGMANEEISKAIGLN